MRFQGRVVVLTGAVYTLPERFKAWLKPGGRLFAVTGESPVQHAIVFTRDGTNLRETSLFETDLAYLTNALARFGITPKVREDGGAKPAAAALREAVAGGPCVAWVDMVHLPHRGLPSQWSGGAYHVVTVYRVEDDGTALIGDLTDAPIAVPVPRKASRIALPS